eukprot:Colp12_sorted_trinity150504_noHs@4863
MALKEPHKYVLKPQREGGGNNLYGQQLAQALGSMPASERSAYILMDRIVTPPTLNYQYVDEQLFSTNVVSELGVFGTLITRGSEIVHNRVGGYLMRTKSADKEDGGVAAGVAVLDSPLLVDQF